MKPRRFFRVGQQRRRWWRMGQAAVQLYRLLQRPWLHKVVLLSPMYELTLWSLFVTSAPGRVSFNAAFSVRRSSVIEFPISGFGQMFFPPVRKHFRFIHLTGVLWASPLPSPSKTMPCSWCIWQNRLWAQVCQRPCRYNQNSQLMCDLQGYCLGLSSLKSSCCCCGATGAQPHWGPSERLWSTP